MEYLFLIAIFVGLPLCLTISDYLENKHKERMALIASRSKQVEESEEE